MAQDLTQITKTAQQQAFAFDPTDTSAGSASFVEDDTQFFQQMTDALFDQDGVDVGPLAAEAGAAIAPDTAPQKVMYRNGQAKGQASVAKNLYCGFVAGVVIQTDKGQKQVQDVCPGDRILTRDHGFRPIVWVGQRTVSLAEQVADPALCPVSIACGALGPDMPDRPMQLPPDQGLMVEGPRTKLLFGTKEVLVPVSHLAGYPGIERAPLATVEYFYLMCAAHEVIWADSIWTESFQAGDPSAMNLDAPQRTTLEAAFAQHGVPASGLAAARRTLLRNEADLLLA